MIDWEEGVVEGGAVDYPSTVRSTTMPGGIYALAPPGNLQRTSVSREREIDRQRQRLRLRLKQYRESGEGKGAPPAGAVTTLLPSRYRGTSLIRKRPPP